MALGFAPSKHRSRARSYNASTAMTLKSFRKAIAKGNCPGARSMLVEASITAGAAYAEDYSIGRKKQKSISAHPAIKAVRVAKKLMSAACKVSAKKGGSFKKMSKAEAASIDKLMKKAAKGKIKGVKVRKF